MRFLSTKSLAHFASRHPWKILAVWAVILVAAIFCMSQLLDTAIDTQLRPEVKTESDRVQEIIDREFKPAAGSEFQNFVIINSDSTNVGDSAFRTKVEAITKEVRGAKDVNRAVNFYQTNDRSLVSSDGKTTLIPIAFKGKLDEVDATPAVEAIKDEGAGGFKVAAYGEAIVDVDFQELSQHDLKEGELKVGLPAALIILLLVFGAIVAASLPLLIAALSIISAMGLAALVGQAYTLSVFVINIITAIGLAVGIDYALFILSRYREERARGLSKYRAIDKSAATASRAVLFSGVAVIVGLSGLAIVPASVMRSLGLGAIMAAAFAVLAALTIFPALLGLFGDRVNSLQIPYFGRAASAGEGRFWGHIANIVLRRPVISLVLAVGLLLAAAYPVLDMKTGLNRISSFPESTISRQGFDLYDKAFGGRIDPVQIVINDNLKSSEVQASVKQLQESMKGSSILGQPEPLVFSSDGRYTLLNVPLMGDPSSKQARDTIWDLRDQQVPQAFKNTNTEVLVGGATAGEADFVNINDKYLPYVLAIVLTLSFLLLIVAFRSIVLPIKAILINLLSVGAAYGLLVLVFQKGVGVDLLGFQQVDTIEAWIPIFLFAILFGLSMDYHVFLLSRIKEHYLELKDNTKAVAFGITSTARLITGAALIIVAVFVGFASGDLVMFQQMGFGLAVALLLDATIIRSVIVPASMKLLGHWNWYLPKWLNWLPNFSPEFSRESTSNKK
jgi:RND superfamily putative drug exporter